MPLDSPRLSFKRPLSLDATYALIALAPIALRVLALPIAPNDFWWHMAQGRVIAQTGRVPTVDAFSYTRAGSAFFDQSWLSQWLFYALHQIGGLPLIIAVQTLGVLACYGLVAWLAVRRGAAVRVVVGVLLLGIVPMSLDNWQIRPQTFALPLFAAYFVLLAAYRLKWTRALWPLPILMALWVNLHGSFEQGLALIVLTLLGEAWRRKRGDDDALTWLQWRRLAVWGALSFGATLLNPRGMAIYGYVHSVLRHPSTQFSSEWSPPLLSNFSDVWFLAFVAVCAVIIWKRRPQLPLTDWLIMLPFLLVALRSGRSILWFGVVALPLVSLMLTPRAQPQTQTETTRASGFINIVLVLILWLPVAIMLPWIKPSFVPPPLGDLIEAETPTRAVNFLRRMPQNQRPHRLFHDEANGSYLIWAAPEQRVFIDTRFELYPPQQWRDEIELKNGRNVPHLLQKYRFDGLLLNRKQEKNLVQEAQKLGWRAAYQDANTVLLLPPRVISRSQKSPTASPRQ